MNAALGWTLAVLAVAAGYAAYGWPGVALAVTVVVFWLLLQFSRSLRVMRGAAQSPVGQVPSAVMVHARLARGMRLLDVLRLTRSLGERAGENAGDQPEAFVWRDASGATLRVEFERGRCSAWQLSRPDDGPP